MIERGSEYPSPEVFLTVLFEASGGQKSGLELAKSIVQQGLVDPIEEAKIDAGRGVLGNAMEYLLASNLTPIGKIMLAKELSITVSRYFEENPGQTELERAMVLRSATVTLRINEFLEAENK